jgi:hypothetical protein
VAVDRIDGIALGDRDLRLRARHPPARVDVGRAAGREHLLTPAGRDTEREELALGERQRHPRHRGTDDIVALDARPRRQCFGRRPAAIDA